MNGLVKIMNNIKYLYFEIEYLIGDNATKPSIINEEFVLNYSTLPKKNLKSAISVMTKGHKNIADTGDDGSDAQLKSYSICYGSN